MSELGERNDAKRLKNLQSEGTADGSKGGSRNGVEGGNIVDNQVTIENLNTIERGSGELTLKSDITLKGGAGRNSVQVRL